MGPLCQRRKISDLKRRRPIGRLEGGDRRAPLLVENRQLRSRAEPRPQVHCFRRRKVDWGPRYWCGRSRGDSAGTVERFFNPTLAFTPKGTRLACSCWDHIYVWDVATGALFRDLSLSGANLHVGENLICPSEDHVLANTLLINVETQARLWTYRGQESVAMCDGICWFFVVGNNQCDLLPAVLPQPSAVEKIEKAMQSPDFFVVKPGVTVKLDVSGLPDAGEREKAAAALTKKLQANNCQVGPTGTVELVAMTEAGKRREVAYHGFGGVARAYSVQEFFTRLKIVYQGKTAWEISKSSVPGMFRLEKGETMEQHLKQSEHPDYGWFSQVELPKVVQKPNSGAATLGTSQVTTAGLK